MADFLLNPNTGVHARQQDCSFAVPPLDGSLTLPQLFDWHYKHNPDHPVFVYSDVQGEKIYHSYADFVPAAHRAAQLVAKRVGIDLNQDPSTYPTVAIFAATDPITYFTTLVGLLRAGIPIFPISPRFSVGIVTQLLSVTNSSHVLTSAEPSLINIAQDAVEGLRTPAYNSVVPGVSQMPLYEEIYNDRPFITLPPLRYDLTSTVLTLHSSGSTSFPKPIRWNARAMLQYTVMSWFGTHDLCGQVFSCPALELFHSMGVLIMCVMPATGYIMSTLRPVSPAVTPTADTAFQALVDTNASYALCPPGLISAWSRDPGRVARLRELKYLTYGGRFLSKSVGDFLAREGVTIHTIYGTTETGLICGLFPDSMGLDWEYFGLNAHCATDFVPVGGGVYKLYILSCATQEIDPAIINTKRNGQDAYDTGDFLIPHPEVPGRWRVLGRVDDQIMLASGDVINPCPLEDRLSQLPTVSTAMMFGRGKPHTGVLFELKDEDAFDPQDETKLEAFRELIWPKIEEMNDTLPIIARIIKDMILVSSRTKPFTFTQKGVPRRAVILQQYQAEIDAVYSSSRERNLPAPVPLVAL